MKSLELLLCRAWLWMGLAFLFIAPAQAVNTPSLLQIAGKNAVVGQTLYLNITTGITVSGIAEANRTVLLYDGGTLIDSVTASSGSGSYSLTVNLSPGAHALSVAAREGADESTASPAVNVHIDTIAPVVTAQNQSVWQGNASYVGTELTALYANVTDSGGAGIDFNSAVATVYNHTTGLWVAGSVSHNGTNRVDFVPTAGYGGGGSFSDGHNYTLSITVSDYAGNPTTSTNQFIVDYTFQYMGPTNGIIPRYIYDPNHAVALGANTLGSGEPANNYPQTIPGYGSGWVQFYSHMYIHTNPTRLLMEVVPCETSTWMAGPNLVGFGEYYGNWNGSWWYSFLPGGPWPTKSLDANCMVETVSWLRPYTMPPTAPVYNWFYIRDSAYNRTTEDVAYYYMASGTPPAPVVNWNGSGIYERLMKGSSNIIPTITGTVTAMSEPQTVSLWGHNIPKGTWTVTVPAGQTTFTAPNPAGYTYSFGGGGGDLYVSSSNALGEGPNEWFRVYTDGIDPAVNYYSIPHQQYFSPTTVDANVTVRVDNGPYWGEAYLSVWAFDTAASWVRILNHGGSVVSGSATSWSHISGTDNWNGTLPLNTTTFAEGEHTIQVYAKDYFGYDTTVATQKFRVDNTPPVAQNIVPGNGEVPSIPSFNADIVDPPLSQAPGGTPGSGVQLDLGQNQIDPYKLLGVGQASTNSLLTVQIHTPKGDQAVNHRDNVLAVGSAVQVWDAGNGIVGLGTDGNSLLGNATIVSNGGGYLQVQMDLPYQVLSPAPVNYQVYYLIPHFDSNDGATRVASVPIETAISPGVYASRITAYDRVGNGNTTISTTDIRMSDPPSGEIKLHPTSSNIYILGDDPQDRTVVISEPILTGSGVSVPINTMVTVSVTSPGVIVEPDAYGLPSDGHQIATDAAGRLQFTIRAVDKQTMGSATVTATVASATGSTIIHFLRPVLQITKAADVTSRALGQVITYTLNYSNTGNSAASNVVISDQIPSGTEYVPGSIILNGEPQADASAFQSLNNRVRITLASLAADASGVLTFQVIVQ